MYVLLISHKMLVYTDIIIVLFEQRHDNTIHVWTTLLNGRVKLVRKLVF